MVDALAELRDIHLPLPVHPWWPLAPGYFLVMIISLIFLISIFFIYRLHRHSKRIKKAALQKLSLLSINHQSGTLPANDVAANINILLKQVALSYYPRTTVASLEGEDWLLFLSNTSKKLDFDGVRKALLHLPYARHQNTEEDLTKLFIVTRGWIQQRSRPCSS